MMYNKITLKGTPKDVTEKAIETVAQKASISKNLENRTEVKKMKVRISADLNTLKEIKTFLEGISQSIENIPEDCTHLEYQTADKMVIFDNPIFPESLCRRTQEYSPKK